MPLENKHFFIFGGTGSVGVELIKKYISSNHVINYSRDEKKHWDLDSMFRSNNLKNIIGDIINYNNIETSLLRENPHVIIITSALKHIDRCEYATGESINTNVLGIRNIMDCIEANRNKLTKLETVIFISTDKACHPVSVYGMCKSLAERIVIEKSKFITDIKFVCVRFGNILNSSGSLIPLLHNLGKDHNVKEFKLTDKSMTRSIISIDDAIELIDHSIIEGQSGYTIVPKLRSSYISDLIEIFSEIYKKPVVLCGLRPGERMYEVMVNDSEALRTVESDKYYYIRPQYLGNIPGKIAIEYTSKDDILTKQELKDYLVQLRLL